ncbi:MAG TPA: hypothetical protein VHQ65_14895, partial [Thermoanaerobaculia bacterium]|nr:hypothetical protein [Thermoanaerobaculia bacterium]
RREHEAAAAELAAVREARGRVEGRLEVAGERDLFERLEDARGRRQAALSAAASVERRAGAAARLYAAMAAAREEARNAYSEPLRRCLGELGAGVFGPGFAVELDGELAVARRTAGGLTLPVERLSAGAREQLALLARVACAVLVTRTTKRGGGVPLLVDDALGHSDAERLRSLGEVLSLAGERCQVIILTCFPERYRFLRAPAVVRLGRSTAAETEHQGAGDE